MTVKVLGPPLCFQESLPIQSTIKFPIVPSSQG